MPSPPSPKRARKSTDFLSDSEVATDFDSDSSDDGAVKSGDEENYSAAYVESLKDRIAELEAQNRQQSSKRSSDETLKTVVSEIKELITLERKLIEVGITSVDEKLSYIKNESEKIQRIGSKVDTIEAQLEDIDKYKKAANSLIDDVNTLLSKVEGLDQMMAFSNRTLGALKPSS